MSDTRMGDQLPDRPLTCGCGRAYWPEAGGGGRCFVCRVARPGPGDDLNNEPPSGLFGDELGESWPAWQRARYAQLLDALDGVPLSADELRSLRWLAGWEAHTVENVCSVIRKARTVGPIEGVDR